SGVIVKLADLEAGRRALADANIPATIAAGAIRVDVPADQSERVSRTLAQAGLYVTELRPDTVDLETVFLELTKDQGVGDWCGCCGRSSCAQVGAAWSRG